MIWFIAFAAAVLSASAAEALFRCSIDGGQTWCGTWNDLPGAVRYVVAAKNPTGTAEENIIELCADATMAAATVNTFYRQDNLCYTLRSKTDGSGARHTISGANGNYVLATGAGQHVVVSNIVFSGGVFTLGYNWAGGSMTLGPGFKATGFSMSSAKPMFNGQDATTALTLLEGAEITDNTGLSSAIVVPGTFNMYGGTIARNTATGNGAAVCMQDYNTGSFYMYGGAITNNVTTGNGGAVYGGRGGVVIDLRGGVITGNRATNGGAFYPWQAGNRPPINISGDLRITGNTLSDGTTKSNLVLYDATQLTLSAPLSATAAVGVTYAGGASQAKFGLASCEGPSANARNIVYDLNPVDGKTRYGCALGGYLTWADEEDDPSAYPFRTTKDAGATWTYKKTFIEAVRQLGANLDCTNNVVEILKDAATGDGPIMSHGAVTSPYSFTFRSGNVGTGARYTLTRNHQGGLLDAGGAVTYVFTNVVVTGGTNFFLRSTGTAKGGLCAELRDGFVLRNCDCSWSGETDVHPISVGNLGVVKMYSGAEISSCKAQSASAVYAAAGFFEMYGGTIHSCTSTVSGAAVETGEFNDKHRIIALYGGTITNNATASTQDGGGVAITDNRDTDTYWKSIDIGGRVVVAGNRNANGPCDLSVRLANHLRVVQPLLPGSDVRCTYSAATAKGARFAVNETGRVVCGAQYLGRTADLSLRGKDDGTGAIVWQDGLVVSGASVSLAGNKTVSFGHADIGLDGVPAGVWTVDGTLTIADGAKFTLNADVAPLKARRISSLVLAQANSIVGCFRPEDCEGVPDGWRIHREGNTLVLRVSIGFVMVIRRKTDF